MSSDHGEQHPPDHSPISRSPHDQGGTATELSLMVPPTTRAPSIARDALRRWLASSPFPPGAVADLLLVLSELVTNAVVHAMTEAHVRVTVNENWLRLEVHDRSSGPPRLRNGGDTPGGYGLQLVATIADDWGWSTTPTGKVVWAEHRNAIAITADAPSPSPR